jgi:hypothetical protein
VKPWLRRDSTNWSWPWPLTETSREIRSGIQYEGARESENKIKMTFKFKDEFRQYSERDLETEVF